MSGGDFAAGQSLAMEKKLGEVGEHLDVADGDAIGGDQLEELTRHAFDVADGGELAGGWGDLRGDLLQFDTLEFFARVKEAEGGVAFVTEHAAAASVGEGELAEERLVRCDSGAGGLGGFHGDS